MIYIDIEHCDECKYFELLNYIFQQCNWVTFHFPNFMNKGSLDIRLDDRGNKNLEYGEYIKKNELLIAASLKHGGKKIITKTYNDVSLAYNTQVITVKLIKEIKEQLLQHHIFEWMYPNLPEDICFFKDNCCRFVSETHEGVFFIKNEKNDDIVFLRQHGFDHMIRR